MKNPALLSLSLSVWCAVLIAAALSTGCVSVRQKAPDKRHFALEVAPPPRSDTRKDAVLEVRKVDISRRYAGQSLVYRIGEMEYNTDHYNQFLAPPADIVTDQIVPWLDAAGPFRHTIHAGSLAGSDYTLEGAVLAMYGDYRDKRAPKAVLHIHFSLLDTARGHTGIVFTSDYLRTAPLKTGAPEELPAGWSAALGRILASLVADMAQLDLVKSTAAP